MDQDIPLRTAYAAAEGTMRATGSTQASYSIDDPDLPYVVTVMVARREDGAQR